MAEKQGKRYLVVFEINPATSERLADFVPKAKFVLSNLSPSGIEQALRSVQADIFGWVIRSKRNVHQVLKLLESPTDVPYPLKPLGEPFLTNQDHILVLEIGEEFTSTRGFSRLTTWLQRH